MSFDLRVPFAYLEDGSVIRPSNAERGVNLFCPSCAEPLVYRKGEKVIAHFAHRSGGQCASYETIVHKVAKNELAKRIRESLAGHAPRQTFKRACDYCGSNEIEQGLPASIWSVGVEKRAVSGYTPDLTLYDAEGTARCGIEVLVFSAVSDEKAVALGIPWIEIEAKEIMAGLGREGGCYAVHRDSLPKFACTACQKAVFGAYRVALSVLDQWGLQWPTAPFYVSYGDCWSCGCYIPFFDWNRQQFPTPPTPRPYTVQHRYSRTTDSKYWANTCPNCRRLQGDFFVFNEPGGAFFPDEDDKMRFIGAQKNGELDLSTGRLNLRQAPEL